MKKFILWQKFKSITPSTRTMLLRRGLKFAVVFFIFTKVFPPPGFCAASFSFPSDEDYIVFSLGKLDPEIVKLDKGDTTAKNYYKNHPDCCYVNRWGGGMWGMFPAGLFNTSAIEVTISYTLTRYGESRHGGDGKAETEETHTSWNTIDGCGMVLGHSSSTDSKI